MRKNAIIRICTYSLLILVLLGLVCTVLLGQNWFPTDRRFDSGDLIQTGGQPTALSAKDIHSIQIDWAWGDITIRPGDTDEILVAEEAPSNAKSMVLEQKGDKLMIQFWQKQRFFGFNNPPRKDLSITVPKDWECSELEFDAAKGNIILTDLTVREVDFDGADVDFDIRNCTIGNLDIDTASGKVKFTGTLDTLDMDGASTSFTGIFDTAPRSLMMDGMSGEMDITLPQDCGFTATLDGMSCKFSSDLATASINGSYVYGDGRSQITADGMSMSVHIRQAA